MMSFILLIYFHILCFHILSGNGGFILTFVAISASSVVVFNIICGGKKWGDRMALVGLSPCHGSLLLLFCSN